MKKVVSKATTIGLFFVAGYLLVTTGAVFYSLTCSGIICSLTIALPVLPWLLLLEPILPSTAWTYFAIVACNGIIIFFVGKYIGQLIIEREHRKNLQQI